MIVFLLFFLISPLASLGLKSFSGSEPGAPLTLAFYRALAENPRESLFYVPPATALGVSLGYGLITVVTGSGLGITSSLGFSEEEPHLIGQDPGSCIDASPGNISCDLGPGFPGGAGYSAT